MAQPDFVHDLLFLAEYPVQSNIIERPKRVRISYSICTLIFLTCFCLYKWHFTDESLVVFQSFWENIAALPIIHEPNSRFVRTGLLRRNRGRSMVESIPKHTVARFAGFIRQHVNHWTSIPNILYYIIYCNYKTSIFIYYFIPCSLFYHETLIFLLFFGLIGRHNLYSGPI